MKKKDLVNELEIAREEQRRTLAELRSARASLDALKRAFAVQLKTLEAVTKNRDGLLVAQNDLRWEHNSLQAAHNKIVIQRERDWLNHMVAIGEVAKRTERLRSLVNEVYNLSLDGFDGKAFDVMDKHFDEHPEDKVEEEKEAEDG